MVRQTLEQPRAVVREALKILLAAERYLYYYHSQYRFSYAALRYANVYGPRQDSQGAAGMVAIFCGNLAEGNYLKV